MDGTKEKYHHIKEQERNRKEECKNKTPKQDKKNHVAREKHILRVYIMVTLQKKTPQKTKQKPKGKTLQTKIEKKQRTKEKTHKKPNTQNNTKHNTLACVGCYKK